MRFIDEATIQITAGHGGPGSVSFMRDANTPRGGPDGGDGGRGGDVIFVATVQLGTLQDFRFKRTYAATGGSNGSGANKTGRAGNDVVIRIPVGTCVRDTSTQEVLFDFTEDGQTWIACKGGRGGKGNAHFVSSTFQAPRFAQPGEVGEFKEITLELKLLADVGIIGFPNAGKSTLISRMSAARPKIADYPFTTLVPNLGVVALPSHESFVVADIPGLIEGAHRGAGLGHKFLKHIEKTQLFAHVLDGTAVLEDATVPGMSASESVQRAVNQAVERVEILRNELGLFNPELLDKPEVLIVNKIDLLESEPSLLSSLEAALTRNGQKPWFISSATGKGIPELTQKIYLKLKELRTASLGPKNILLPDSPRLVQHTRPQEDLVAAPLSSGLPHPIRKKSERSDS